MQNMNDDDLLLVTADHGNDPTYRGCACDLGATILDNFNVSAEVEGTSFLPQIA